MEKIKIYYTDFWEGFDPKTCLFTSLLESKYEVVFDKCNPDFIICSCFGENFINYKCPRLYFTGENNTPNFNIYDYAVGFDYMDFPERYLRIPLYYFTHTGFIRDNIKPPVIDNPLKREFCNFLYSNDFCADKKREEFFKKLSRYKHIHSGGSALNNIGYKVKNKHDFIKNFKFTIAFENSSSEGYITEKIYDAFFCRTIPIYWGNPLANIEFNPKAFINIHDFDSFDESIEKIIEIDNNDELYIQMLNEPYLIENKFYDGLNDEKILAFLDNIVKNKEKYYRKDVLPLRDKDGLLPFHKNVPPPVNT